MKKLYLTLIIILFTATASMAQFTYPVNVVSNDFQPQSITITQGDAIEWECTEGFHNVDGSLDTYPDNPEGFSSGDPEGAPWTYTFTFTEEGTYTYQCNVHSETMTGTVIVSDVTGISESDQTEIDIYPNPTNDFVFVEGVDAVEGTIRLAIFEITGKKVIEEPLIGQKRFDLSELSSGIYLYNLFADNELIQTGKIARN